MAIKLEAGSKASYISKRYIRVEYYEKCKRCVHGCKQSFRITRLQCRKYKQNDE